MHFFVPFLQLKVARHASAHVPSTLTPVASRRARAGEIKFICAEKPSQSRVKMATWQRESRRRSDPLPSLDVGVRASAAK